MPQTSTSSGYTSAETGATAPAGTVPDFVPLPRGDGKEGGSRGERREKPRARVPAEAIEVGVDVDAQGPGREPLGCQAER